MSTCVRRVLTLAQALRDFILSHCVVHADETPVSLLAPRRGKTKRAYVWVYRTTNYVAQRAVFYDFCTSRGAVHPRRVLQGFEGTLVTHGLQTEFQNSTTALVCKMRKFT